MYIRTKDGVYDLENDDIVKIGGKYKKCYVQKDTGDTCFKDIEVINVSENIAELCDLFIDEETKAIFHKHNGYVINWRTHYVFSLKELALYFPSTKGAIYTSKGLIYVAKMNEDGVLCLI